MVPAEVPVFSRRNRKLAGLDCARSDAEHATAKKISAVEILMMRTGISLSTAGLARGHTLRFRLDSRALWTTMGKRSGRTTRFPRPHRGRPSRCFLEREVYVRENSTICQFRWQLFCH